VFFIPFMYYVNQWALGGSLFLISIVSLVLLVRGGKQHLPQKILGVCFLGLIWYGITYLVVSTGNLINFPFVYRIGCPFYYLIPPCFYLYIQFSLKRKSHLRKADGLHLIPFALALVDMSAYYFGMSAEEKMSEIWRVQKSPILIFDTGAGFLPAISHFYFRVLQSVIYLFLQWRLLISARKSLQEGVDWLWIVGLSLFETLLYTGNLMMVVFGRHREDLSQAPLAARSFQFIAVLMILSLAVISYYMLFKPALLYGQEFQLKEAGGKEIQATREVPVSLPKTEYCHMLETYLLTEKPFLRKRLTLSELAAELDLPSYILSGLLNHHYKQNFNDFINDYRIRHVINRMKNDPNWKALSMEGLAQECGFSSRTAFYAAFKKRINSTPAAYMAGLGDGDQDRL